MQGVMCQVCQKRPATSHLVELEPDHTVARELHICGACVRNLQLDLHHAPPDIDAILQQETSISTKDKSKIRRKRKDTKGLKCPACGLTFQDFAGVNRFGCTECYDAFGALLLEALREIHGADQHLGRVPGSAATIPDRRSSERARLQQALADAIAHEAYEDAARLRDQLAALP